MKEDLIKKLVEETFSRLCSPTNGHGMYAEIEKALSAAYSLGKAELFTTQIQIAPEEKLRYLNIDGAFSISA